MLAHVVEHRFFDFSELSFSKLHSCFFYRLFVFLSLSCKFQRKEDLREWAPAGGEIVLFREFSWKCSRAPNSTLLKAIGVWFVYFWVFYQNNKLETCLHLAILFHRAAIFHLLKYYFIKYSFWEALQTGRVLFNFEKPQLIIFGTRFTSG